MVVSREKTPQAYPAMAVKRNVYGGNVLFCVKCYLSMVDTQGAERNAPTEVDGRKLKVDATFHLGLVPAGGGFSSSYEASAQFITRCRQATRYPLCSYRQLPQSDRFGVFCVFACRREG